MKKHTEYTLEETLLYSTPIEVYQMVLRGELSRFPNGFWSGPSNNDSAQITRYLIEHILGWTSDKQIKENLRAKTFKQNKLGGLLSSFEGSPYAAINNAYPGRFQPWELQVIPVNFNDREIALQATKWLIEKQLKLVLPDDLKYLKREHFYEHQIGFAFSHFHSMYDCISTTYPELDIQKYHMRKVPNGQSDKDNAVAAIKNYLSNVLGISSVDEIYQLSLSDFKDVRVSPAIRFFDDQYKRALIETYGDELNPWLFKSGVPAGYFKDKSHRIKALKWLIYERLHLDEDTVYNLTYPDFKKNKLERMLADYYSNNLDKVFLELYGVSRDEYIQKIYKTTYKKIFSKSECSAGTYVTLPSTPFEVLFKSEEVTIIVDDKAICTGYIRRLRGCVRLTGMSPFYKTLEVEAGDEYVFNYVKGDSYIHIYSN